ncbi:Regulator of nucleoside diphosphate kinase [Chryseobacterium taklimakanense]|uniref:Regulator of nucleoside diphosphate kinase n=1 Tax=Chryseobacterium taklimakanense TaxID=536441 RepID=A0A239WQN6_9FLAO|nr:nucleoside diphosphate kinase regulator [Chryseobacterium taklimakanense]SNV36158.1 Regulator of nucleoside diphosphate kinase [Chryseobacterium taklimakanense]
MSQIIINKNDYTRIHQSINLTKQNNAIKKDEAEKLMNELKSAKLVEPNDIPEDVVTMNSVVKIHFQNNKQKMQFKIVYPKDANLKENKISIFSAVASALIGYKVGDEIEWLLPSGMTKIVIDEIIYQPEAAGDLDL